MATAHQHLDSTNDASVPSGQGKVVAIIRAEWNDEITSALAAGAHQTLIQHGVDPEHIISIDVPGAVELTYAAKRIHEQEEPDAVIIVGCVIQGETKHFVFVCEAASLGIKDVNLKVNTPISFCLLTDNTMQQSIDRSGGKHGNKGIECAIACLKMIALKKSF